MSGTIDPWLNKVFIGHTEIIRQLNQLKNSKSINNTLIFNGPIGVGKCTLAFRYCNYIFANTDIAFIDYKQKNDNIFSQVSNHSFPNLCYISKNDEYGNSREIKIEDIRNLKESLAGKLLNGGQRVIIIDTINDLNRSSQNALLKILEEPPKDTLFILITHSISSLPDTILSRCLKINFKNLSLSDTNQVLAHVSPEIEIGPTQDIYGESISPGKIIYLVNNNFEEIVEDFNSLIGKSNVTNQMNIFRIIKYYSKKENILAFNILFELFMIWLKKNAISLLADLNEDYKLYELLSYWDKYSEKFNNLNIFNLDRGELLLSIHKDVCYLSDRKIDE